MTRTRTILWLAGALAFVCCVVGNGAFFGTAAYAQPSPRIGTGSRVRAPSLDGGTEWLNTAAPIQLEQLRGKFVILDFWTYCCINCLQTLPELQKLEREFPNELVVIGVHSPKFANERETVNLREAVMRYEVEHPVVNDANMVLWRKYGVLGWPTLRVIDPEGYVVASHEGEATFEQLQGMMRRMISVYRRRGALDETPLLFSLERDQAKPTALRFPGKVLADQASNRLFIADSGQHRIVIASLDGGLLDVIGTGAIGQDDGGYDEATFDHPQGMALDGDTLYVADTENHLIRRIDLNERQVTTFAGTGEMAYNVIVRPSSRPTSVRLSSPWDLYIHDRELYIAMAGKHQIWKMTLSGSRIEPYAGNGAEDIIDGPLLPRSPGQQGFAAFAQPSGLTSDGKWLFVADSEGSSIRAIPFQANEPAQTVLGTSRQADNRLFTFGDRDGATSRALLQHPLGVAYDNGRIYIADTYNHKVKEIDLRGRSIRTIAGDGKPGIGDSPAQLNEPSGISFAGDKLYVADTNNHAIRVIDLRRNHELSTLEIAGLAPPKPVVIQQLVEIPGAKSLSFGEAEIKPVDGRLKMNVELTLPDGHKLNSDAPISYRVDVADNSGVIDPSVIGKPMSLEEPKTEFDISLPLSSTSGIAKIKISLTYYYCREDAEGLCKIGAVNWTGDVRVSSSACGETIRLTHEVR